MTFKPSFRVPQRETLRVACATGLRAMLLLAGTIAIGLFLGAGVSQMVRAQTSAPQTPIEDAGASVMSQTDAVKSWLKTTQTLKARFIQQGGDGKIVRGEFTMAQPGRMRFEYEPSVPILVVADGQSVYFVDYEVDQLSCYPIKETPLAPLLSPEDIDAVPLQVAQGPFEGSLAVTSLDPKHREYGSLTLMFEKTGDAPEDLSLAAWSVLDGQGSLTQITLSEVETNVDVPRSRFSFKDPRRRGTSGRCS